MGRTVDFLCFCCAISCHANMSGHLRYGGQIGRTYATLSDIQHQSVNYLNFHTRKKAPNNFVSHEVGARFVSDFSPISFQFP